MISSAREELWQTYAGMCITMVEQWLGRLPWQDSNALPS